MDTSFASHQPPLPPCSAFALLFIVLPNPYSLSLTQPPHINSILSFSFFFIFASNHLDLNSQPLDLWSSSLYTSPCRQSIQILITHSSQTPLSQNRNLFAYISNNQRLASAGDNNQLLQCCALRTFHVTDGQSTCDQITSDRRYKRT